MKMRNEQIKSLTSQKRLSHFLGCSREELRLFETDKLYDHWPKKYPNGKIRMIEAPLGMLKSAHETFLSVLRTEEMPEWVYSRKGRDHVANAFYHARPRSYTIKMDVEKFYPSCSERSVFTLFKDENGYNLSGDMASRISRMLCFKGHIPTGSPVSSYLAFLSHYNCFYEIHTLSRAHGEDMTLYVDDMTFSSRKKPSKWFILTVGKVLIKYGLSCNIRKTTIYMPDENEKILTGVCVNSSGKIFPTSKQLQKIDEEMAIPEIERNPHRLRGMIAHKDRILNYKQKHSANAPHSVKLRG